MNRDIKCRHCGKKLAEKTYDGIEIRCRGCGVDQTIPSEHKECLDRIKAFLENIPSLIEKAGTDDAWARGYGVGLKYMQEIIQMSITEAGL